MGAGPGNVTLQPEQSEKIIYPEVYSSRQSHVTVVVGGPASPYIPVQVTPINAPLLDSYHVQERLPFCGCGVGMFLLLIGFIAPISWFIGAFIFFFIRSINRDRREYNGLLACTIAATCLALALYGSGGFKAIWEYLEGDIHHH